MIDHLTKLGIKCYVITTQHAFDIRIVSQVRQIIKREKVDIIHTHGTRAFTNTLLASTRMKIPIIYTVHGWSFHNDQSLLTKLIRINIERLLTSSAHKTILVSKSNLTTGAKHFIKGSFKVIPNGIDLQKFKQKDQKCSIRDEFNLPEEAFLVGFIARMTKQKDPIGMVRAFHLAIKDHPEMVLLMVGEGELREQLDSEMKRLKLEQNVVCINFRQDVPNILSALDLYCLPSLWEGLPIGLLEAMAAGKAVIATRVDGSKEIIEDAKNGILVNSSSPTELADAIIRLKEDEELRLSIGKSAGKELNKSSLYSRWYHALKPFINLVFSMLNSVLQEVSFTEYQIFKRLAFRN